MPGWAEGIRKRVDLENGWPVFELAQGDLVVEVVPDAGCNVRSIRYRGRELLRQAPSLAELRGTRYGVPVLYPTPNRVRDARFTFDGRTYAFEPNKGPNFIHGLVKGESWEVAESRQLLDRSGMGESACELECRFVFAPGRPVYALFPHPHVLSLTVRVSPSSVRWTYRVDNSRGATRVPFGFGLHPWFRYQGPRARTYLTVPATHWMEAIELLPTGRLVDLAETAIDIRTARSLDGLVVDDVYFGMTPDRPAQIEHRAAGLSVELAATEDFTHAVVFTPADIDAFCVENQTCSTDAHNLHALGLERASHLLIAEPGEVRSGSVELRLAPAGP